MCKKSVQVYFSTQIFQCLHQADATEASLPVTKLALITFHKDQNPNKHLPWHLAEERLHSPGKIFKYVTHLKKGKKSAIKQWFCCML